MLRADQLEMTIVILWNLFFCGATGESARVQEIEESQNRKKIEDSSKNPEINRTN